MFSHQVSFNVRNQDMFSGIFNNVSQYDIHEYKILLFNAK